MLADLTRRIRTGRRRDDNRVDLFDPITWCHTFDTVFPINSLFRITLPLKKA